MSYPTTPVFNAINMASNRKTLVSQSVSGRTQARKMGGQWWSFTAKYAPMIRSEFRSILAFVESQGGRYGVFSVILPVLSHTTGTATGTVTCSAATAGAESVTIAGLTGTLNAGDYVKFSGHDKVYMVTADRSGAGAISISPGLVAAVTTDTLVYNDVPFKVRLGSDVQSYAINVSQYYMYEVDFVEALT